MRSVSHLMNRPKRIALFAVITVLLASCALWILNAKIRADRQARFVSLFRRDRLIVTNLTWPHWERSGKDAQKGFEISPASKLDRMVIPKRDFSKTRVEGPL